MLRRLWGRVRRAPGRAAVRPVAPSLVVPRPAARPAPWVDRPGRAHYNPDHRPLAVPVPPQDGERAVEGAAPPLDLVAVPTARPWTVGGRLQPGVALALETATARSCPLLILCSGDAVASEAPPELAADPRVWILDLRHWRLLLPRLRTSRHPAARVWGRDTSRKRNVMMAVAWALGCRFVLFLDDDISPCAGPVGEQGGLTLDRGGLDAALLMLERSGRSAAGWRTATLGSGTTGDHSAVGHARLLAGWEQQPFFGAGALLVRLGERVPPFFPEVYSEDWLFLFALVYDHGDPRAALADAGFVAQAGYDPFRVSRARREEFGDTLAEGLFGLLHHAGPQDLFECAVRVSFWREVLGNRRAMVVRLRQAVGRGMACTALDGSLEQARRHRAEDYVRYLHEWRQDLLTWRRWLVRLRLEAKEGWTVGQVLALVAEADPPLADRNAALHPEKGVITV